MRVERTGSFSLPASIERVRPLFTAEGERAWAPGWDPQWPDPEHLHEVGEVWTTSGPPATTWITVRADDDCVRYARVAPGDSAGIVTVSFQTAADGTRVTVAYDLTALSEAGTARLTAFETAYDDMLVHWHEHVAHALERADR